MSSPMLALKMCADDLNKIIIPSSAEQNTHLYHLLLNWNPHRIRILHCMHFKFHLKKVLVFHNIHNLITISSRKHKINVKQN